MLSLRFQSLFPPLWQAGTRLETLTAPTRPQGRFRNHRLAALRGFICVRPGPPGANPSIGQGHCTCVVTARGGCCLLGPARGDVHRAEHMCNACDPFPTRDCGGQGWALGVARREIALCLHSGVRISSAPLGAWSRGHQRAAARVAGTVGRRAAARPPAVNTFRLLCTPSAHTLPPHFLKPRRPYRFPRQHDVIWTTWIEALQASCFQLDPQVFTRRHAAAACPRAPAGDLRGLQGAPGGAGAADALA
jgi:hypothetical protein